MPRWSWSSIAFLHHSNLGEYQGAACKLSRLLWRPSKRWPVASEVLTRLQLTWDHWRGPTVSSAGIVEASRQAGLACIGQEIINWGDHNRRMIDCLSIVTRTGSKWERPNVVVHNPAFTEEARSARSQSKMYSSLRPHSEAEPPAMH